MDAKQEAKEALGGEWCPTMHMDRYEELLERVERAIAKAYVEGLRDARPLESR